jgi:hypothetical protein
MRNLPIACISALPGALHAWGRSVHTLIGIPEMSPLAPARSKVVTVTLTVAESLVRPSEAT